MRQLRIILAAFFIIMNTLRISEDLVVLLALDNYLSYLHELISNWDDPKDSQLELLIETYNIGKGRIDRILKDIPEYERILYGNNDNSLNQQT